MIDLKNKIPRYNLELEPVPNKYHPENDGYRDGIIFMVLVILFTAIVIGIAFILFTICRVACKKCGGEVEEDENFNPDGKGSYVCGIVFLTLFFAASSTILIIGNVGLLNSSININDYMTS